MPTKLWRNKTFMQLTVTLFLVEFVRGAMLISFMPKFAMNELHLSIGVVGFAISAHYISDTAAKTAIGYLLDRISARLVVPVGLLLCMTGVMLLPVSVDLPWLFITAAALYGLGISPIWIVCLAHISDKDRASQIGVIYTVWLVGLGLGPFLVNFFMDSHSYTVYWLLTVILGLSWISSLFLTDRSIGAVNKVSLLSQLGLLWDRVKQVKLLLPGMILQSVGASMLVPVLPIFLEHRLGLSAPVYSFLLLIGGGCTIAGLLLFAKWNKTIGQKLALTFGFVGFAAALLLLAQKPSFPLILICVMVLGFSYSVVLPAWNTLLAQFISPAQASVGWGAFTTIEGIGIMLGPLLGGMLAVYFNLAFPIAFSACLFAGMACFYYFWYPHIS